MAQRVVVLGYGYAGAVAAIAAADAGAQVLLIEKAKTPGGISICSAGGLRFASDADRAFAYLKATNAGKTPDDVLRVLADGMTALPRKLSALAAGEAARIDDRMATANYPFEGNDTFGFTYVEAIEGFDPDRDYPHVRGNPQGALLFRLLERNVTRRPQIRVCLGIAAERLLLRDSAVIGVRLADGREVLGPVILATGGFEASRELQAQYWPGGAMLSAAYLGNTGDGIRMAQAAGADLWHMWHSHACYGFAMPGHELGIRVKRLPDWLPARDGLPDQEVPPVAWIMLDQNGRRFMNEYEPYLQDTGARQLDMVDMGRQCTPRNPAWFVTDADGMALYPMGKPTWNHPTARYDWSPDNQSELAAGLFRKADDAASLAGLIGADQRVLGQALLDWNECCANRSDLFGRPPSSMRPLAPPYYAAPVVPVVSNTQGGPRHDAEQRVLTPYGEPISGLWAAGECGSAFGHLYLSGGNIAECFVGGEMAGRGAAASLENAN